MSTDLPFDAVAFDCFGTLVSARRPDDPAAAVATELSTRGVSVPDDWAAAYAEPHVDAPSGTEVPLPGHVQAALSSRSRPVDSQTVEAAVRAAFVPDARPRDGAVRAVEAAAEHGPVGLLSNCSVPGLVERTLVTADLDADLFDAVVTSVDCGWRKPDPRAFEAAADALGVGPGDLLHVGDDPDADGGADAAGATSLLIAETPLPELADRLADGRREDGRLTRREDGRLTRREDGR